MMYKEINDKARLPNQRNDSSAFESVFIIVQVSVLT